MTDRVSPNEWLALLPFVPLVPTSFRACFVLCTGILYHANVSSRRLFCLDVCTCVACTLYTLLATSSVVVHAIAMLSGCAAYWNRDRHLWYVHVFAVAWPLSLALRLSD